MRGMVGPKRSICALFGIILALGCTPRAAEPLSPEQAKRARARMVEEQIAARGVKDPRVLRALRTVPRHRFAPAAAQRHAYADRPLAIGSGQTMSQPYIVAVMSELAQVAPGERVLEVGTGSGYQAAVLAELGAAVFTIEILPELAEGARRTLAELGYERITVITGDGFRGLPDEAPFDAIVVTAAPVDVPPPLLEQLAPGGRLVIPVGGRRQTLQVLERTAEGVKRTSLFEVRFVPLVGPDADAARRRGEHRPRP